ncbi:MAG TPA: HD-GYP domain-containing protein [Firmicutes bacterium]|nr:HD-GYP domain-containing protein [Bacillota bacterium]
MYRIKVDQLTPGMVLAQDVLIPRTGVTLLPSSTLLTMEMIRRIGHFNIEEVYISVSEKSDKEKSEEILAPVMAETHQKSVAVVEKFITNFDHYEESDYTKAVLDGLVGDLLEQVKMDPDLLLNLTHMKSYDNYLFSHAVNVSIISILIGEQLGYSEEELNLLGIAGLLHDIGMLKISVATWKKTGTLTPTEYKEVRKHPTYGAQYLADMHEDIKAVAAEHHERHDGSGYPKGLKGSEINYKARIVAIADVYDACISERLYRERLTPQEAIRLIVGDQKCFDPQLLKIFLLTMAVYPIGSYVRLNTGEVGRVIRVVKNQPFRPVLSLYYDRKGELLPEPIRLDLSQDVNHLLYIKETLPPTDHKKVAKQVAETFPNSI